MPGQARHPMLVQPTHDEAARQAFCQDMRSHLFGDVREGSRVVFEHTAPKGQSYDRNAIRHAMQNNPYYRVFSACMRSTQELLWDSIIDSVERELPRIVEQYQATEATLGSLTLNPELAAPAYHTAADIHLQPGGYHTEFVDDDVSAGAIYDRAIYLYGAGKYGPYSDSMGRTLLEFLADEKPEFKPKSILEMGCTSGNSLLCYHDAYPEAELHGIDVAAPCLRYAHARAEGLGVPVQFSQQDAAATGFDDERFDLVVSHLLFHETGRSAMTQIIAESRRLLRPGGIMLHLDLPTDSDLEDDYDSFLWDWEAYHNNETFCVVMRNLNYADEALAAGFHDSEVSLEQAPFGWPILMGVKQ